MGENERETETDLEREGGDRQTEMRETETDRLDTDRERMG